MSDYLNTLTVKTLREIAKRIGFRFISRYRKADLIGLIIAEIDACHSEAIREDNIRTQQNAPKVSPIDFPAVNGQVVTEGHARFCANNGHATYVVFGVDQGMCPRCGEFAEWYLAKVMKEEMALAAIEPNESSIPVLAETERKTVIIPATPVIPAFPDSVRSDTYAIDMAPKTEGNDSDTITFDAQDEAYNAMNAIKILAQAAKCKLDTIPGTDARFDAAYQIWLDLSRCAEELERTHYGIAEGLF